MNSMYDIVCSVVIGGVVLAMLVGFNTTIIQESGNQTMKLLPQSNMTAIRDLVESDFRKIGCLVPATPDSAIVSADSSKIKFKADIYNNGTVDTIQYSIDLVTATHNGNANTHYLNRTVTLPGGSSTTTKMNLGTTSFKLYYYKSGSGLGTPFTSYPVTTPSLIKGIKVVLNIEATTLWSENSQKNWNSASFAKFNPGVYWEKFIRPKNLR